jgi:hypothetical protein
MKVRYTKRAFANREKVFDYLDERNRHEAMRHLRFEPILR